MKPLVSILLSMLILNTYAQSDSLSNAYTRIMSQVQGYQIDTTTPPTDKTTRLIGQLRELRGGFNINEAVLFKIGEEENKKEKIEGRTGNDKDILYNWQGKNLA